MKEKLTKKNVTIILGIILAVCFIVSVGLKVYKYNNDKSREIEVEQEEDVNIDDVDRVIVVETQEEYLNQQKSNLDKWNKVYEIQKNSIKSDLWTNEKTQQDFIKACEELKKESKRIKNISCEDGLNQLEFNFITSMDHFIAEMDLRIKVIEILNDSNINDENRPVLMNDSQVEANSENQSALVYLEKATTMLDKEMNGTK